MRSLPVMMRDTSRMSSISSACARALRSMVSSAFCSFSGGSVRDRNMRVQPTIALSGVRSSCDSVARNSSFARLAASAASRACALRRPRAPRSASSARLRFSMSVAVPIQPADDAVGIALRHEAHRVPAVAGRRAPRAAGIRSPAARRARARTATSVAHGRSSSGVQAANGPARPARRPRSRSMTDWRTSACRRRPSAHTHRGIESSSARNRSSVRCSRSRDSRSCSSADCSRSWRSLQ